MTRIPPSPVIVPQPVHLRVPDRPPRNRGECAAVERPCRFVCCRFNTFLTVGPTGQINRTWPEAMEPEDVPAKVSCTLDIAEAGDHTPKEIAELFGQEANVVAREAEQALNRLRARMARSGQARELSL